MTPINPYPAAHIMAAEVMSWLNSRHDDHTFRITYALLADYLLEHLDEWFETEEPNEDLIENFFQSFGRTDADYVDGFKRRRSARYHQLISIDADLLTTPQLNDLLAGRNVIGEES